jgi:hypothetical protein
MSFKVGNKGIGGIVLSMVLVDNDSLITLSPPEKDRHGPE